MTKLTESKQSDNHPCCALASDVGVGVSAFSVGAYGGNFVAAVVPMRAAPVLAQLHKLVNTYFVGW